jgi:hypothetical protein
VTAPQECPLCGQVPAFVCGFHAAGAPTGWQPKSHGTKGEHFVSSHRCGGVTVVADHVCGRVAVAADVDEATVALGGYWR